MTPKQSRFVEEYLVDLNATQAAIRAGYSEKTARSVGHENLTKPDIAAAIKAAQGEARERAEITVDVIVAEYEEARQIAKDDRQPAAMVAATMGKAKVLGLIIDRKNVTIFNKPFNQWTIEEKIAVRDALREHNGTTDAVH